MAQWMYGKNAVMQILKSTKKIEKAVMAEGVKFPEAEALIQKRRIPVERVSRKQLDQLCSDSHHQGIAVRCEDFKTLSIEEILARIPQGKLGTLVLLDELEDPHNLGAVLRTCDAVGADGVILRKNRSVSLNATVAKVSTGAIDTIPVAMVANLTQTLKQLKEKGYWVYGADMDHAQDYRQPAFDTPVVLVVGSEGKGISRLVKEECDVMLKLPMEGTISSLNASVACAVMLYQIHSKRFPLVTK